MNVTPWMFGPSVVNFHARPQSMGRCVCVDVSGHSVTKLKWELDLCTAIFDTFF